MSRLSRLMLTMIASAILALAFVLYGTAMAAQPNRTEVQKYYDQRGHYQGRSETRGGVTRHFDKRGHLQGTTRSSPPRR